MDAAHRRPVGCTVIGIGVFALFVVLIIGLAVSAVRWALQRDRLARQRRAAATPAEETRAEQSPAEASTVEVPPATGAPDRREADE